MVEDVGELKYNASNWGALRFAICEYVFPTENGVPGMLTRNSGAGVGDCLTKPAFTATRSHAETLTLTFANPELDPNWAAPAPIAGLAILGVAPAMAFDQIEGILTEKCCARQEGHENENRSYDRSGQVLADAYGCPKGMHQPLRSNYLLASEMGP